MFFFKELFARNAAKGRLVLNFGRGMVVLTTQGRTFDHLTDCDVFLFFLFPSFLRYASFLLF